MSKKLLAMLFAAFLVLGACSDDDGDLATQASGNTTEATTADTDAPDDTEAPDDTTGDTEAPDDTTPGGLAPAEVEEEVEAAVSESLGGLTGGGGDVAIEDDQMTCMLEGVSDDAELLEALLAADSDPTYVVTGEQMVSLFSLMEECDLVPAIAESFMADTPGITQEQAECAVSGMIDLPASTWDVMLSGADASTVDPEVMTQVFTLFSECGIDMALL